MPWKKLIRDYLYFSRNDRIGVGLLLLLITVIYFLPRFFARELPPPSYTALLSRPDSLERLLPPSPSYERSNSKQKGQPEEFRKAELFRFDPNSLDAAGWQRLGLSPRTAQTITRYRSKGGQFRKKEDLQRIWGLPNGFYERVESYIDLPESSYSSFKEQGDQTNYTPFARKEPGPLPLNTADSTALESLPGIGSRLASRIIAFRTGLGGFYSIEQLAELYGLKDSVYQKIKGRLVVDGRVEQISINSATKERLKEHPYIRWKLAGLIVAYREQHGKYTELSQLRSIPLVTDSLYRKLLPYLSLK